MSIDALSLFGSNAGYFAELYQLYKEDPSLVDPAWAEFFKQAGLNGAQAAPNGQTTNGYATPAATTPVSEGTATVRTIESAEPLADAVVDAFRRQGHLIAEVSPVKAGGMAPQPTRELLPDTYLAGKGAEQLSINPRLYGGRDVDSVPALLGALNEIYCGSIGFECEHIVSADERAWLRERIETQARPFRVFTKEARQEIFLDLMKGELLESELHRKFVGAKRFSLEGSETLMPMLTSILEGCTRSGVSEVVFGMAHRGRLNVLVNTVGKPLEKIFTEFEDKTAATVLGGGDVKYHLGYSGSFSRNGSSVTLHIAPNPSHLEFVNPVVEGIARAKQDALFAGDRKAVLPVLMHGDAAFAGQGIVFETLNYAGLEGYTTGGSIHIVINNQIGFTTTPDESRSTRYCTDLAKGLDVPVFHVNAEDPESACWVSQLALEYRNTFGKDVIIDLIGHRKYGHNEGDDPSFTQPLMYAELKSKKPLWQQYSSRLIAAGIIDEAFVQESVESYKKNFAAAQERSQAVTEGEARALTARSFPKTVKTAVPAEQLRELARELVAFPEGFVPHPKLAKIIQKRVETVEAGEEIEWGVGEALAFGALVKEGVPVRLSGQDCRRGTFSHRHLVLDDYEKPQHWSPFGALASKLNNGARFEIYNSSLSEAAVVGFEFGYASSETKGLTMWEAQFGDFSNGAQPIIDQFICSSESKWGQLSGVTLLLPHGYEGQGPEHSSARLERYLQLCAEENMRVCYPTTAAQYFHLLRRQGLSDPKRPLVVMTPKSLLRLPAAASNIKEFSERSFAPLLVEGAIVKSNVLVLMSGKVYYDVAATLKENGLDATVCVARVEELYPFPAEQIKDLLAKSGASRCIWVQEEPQNQGAWTFISPLVRAAIGVEPMYIGRVSAAATATGSGKHHAVEQKAFLSALVDQLRG
jgi:2-oxoglutarate dehydrogenase E1 component